MTAPGEPDDTSGSPQEPTKRPTDRPALLNKLGGSAMDAGWTMSGSVIGGLLAGYLIGEALGANPAATIGGLCIGLLVGFYNLARVMGILK